MKKNDKIIIIIAVIFTSAIIAAGAILLINHLTKSTGDNPKTESSQNAKKIIYSTSSDYSMGTIRVQVYDNGEVYEDVEMEEPDHKIEYKYLKTLSEQELADLKAKIAENGDENKLTNYALDLIYGKMRLYR